MGIEDIKPTLNDEAADKWINNYIFSLPKDWRKDLDMQLAMKNTMLEALAYVNKYTNNHPLQKQIEDLKAENEKLSKERRVNALDGQAQLDEDGILITKLKERVKEALIYGYEIGVQHDQVINEKNVDKWETTIKRLKQWKKQRKKSG